jgi:hypothetical protein
VTNLIWLTLQLLLIALPFIKFWETNIAHRLQGLQYSVCRKPPIHSGQRFDSSKRVRCHETCFNNRLSSKWSYLLLGSIYIAVAYEMIISVIVIRRTKWRTGFMWLRIWRDSAPKLAFGNFKWKEVFEYEKKYELREEIHAYRTDKCNCISFNILVHEWNRDWKHSIAWMNST